MKKHIAIIVSGVLASYGFAADTAKNNKPENESSAYKDALKQDIPLSAEQIRNYKSTLSDTSKAESERNAPRNARIRDVTIRAGSSEINKIFMAEGMSTLISFYDAGGNPINITLPGAVIGDKDSIQQTSLENNVTLNVLRPWRSTNLQVPLEGQFGNKLFIPFTITSEKDPSAIDDVDYQVRVRIVTGAPKTLDKKDSYDMNTLIGMVNGLKLGQTTPLQIAKAEVRRETGDWMGSVANFASFSIGNDGFTYLVLNPGYKLTKNADVLASQIGSDGSSGYIIGGNSPRIFNIINQDGAWYKITLNR